ncbi:glycoside hydrolase family 127 protein [Marilutibacter maris]|nr:beta-L-arabinofuranosidase domain-containing protein [Lysobacter maris]
MSADTTTMEALALTPLPAAATRLDGLLGQALEANRRGRLSRFITGPDSPAIAIFAPERCCDNEEGDWYGEHAGKWLVAAARAAARSGDQALRERVLAVADHLLTRQDEDGYLGNYAPARRFTVPQPPKPESWNGEPALRTWDIWTHSYLVLGLLEVHRQFGDDRHLLAARRIGDLCHRTFVERGLDITRVGNHHGMSATVLIDPVVELYFASGERRYLELAEALLAQAEAQPRLALLSRLAEGADASEIATGKAYQLCWNLVGVAKLARASGRDELRQAVERLWTNIRDHHLSLGGGPFGGIAHRSREVFNPGFVFDPTAYVETCSVLAWVQLSRELLLQTGEARYAAEIERSAYNDLLGAQAENGEDWCYYSFANGPRVHTRYWRCCKSSGAMAIEELQTLAWSRDGDALVLNLLGPGRAEIACEDGALRVAVTGDYPLQGHLQLHIEAAPANPAGLRWRIPDWAGERTVRLNGDIVETVDAHGYAGLVRRWRAGDVIELEMAMAPTLHRRRYRNIQESRAPDGSPVRQQVLRRDYVALTRGPLVYATGLIDGYKNTESVLLPEPAQSALSEAPAGRDGRVSLRLAPLHRAAIEFHPYFDLGGRVDGGWRLTWLELAPAALPPYEDDIGAM